MMMMVSSSSSSTSDRDRQQAPKLVRHNSSFLGAIKDIVTAPFSWFGNPDGGADVTGSKRRRSEPGAASMPASGIQKDPTEIIIEEQPSSSDELDQDGASRRSKRMRLNSPSRTIKAMAESKYTMRRSSLVPRASSAVLPSSRGATRSTLSPKRHTQLYPSAVQRTMSIDPPQLASRRDTPSSSFNFGVDVDMVGLDPRDISMPPSPSRLSPRPSFRMRSSMTPQPVQHVLPQRHISEPPPLNALFSNPVFVHPPLQEKEATPIPTLIHTLGTLVESDRNIRVPVKHQHASLLFNNVEEDEAQKDVPAERALQQLDIYKTPLLPSRMRSDADSITANVIPDMFKSRRTSRPLLVSDDREKSNVKRNKGPIVNETKPYAGEGGMKKLLARAKLEAEKEKTRERDEGAASMDSTREETSQPSSVSLPTPPPPVTSDWFKSAVSGTSISLPGSSLRVGRQKTSRNHIQRPSKSRFSAVYEDEGDDAMEDDEKTKERHALEEAAKKVPVFNIPSGFSFAKDTPAPMPSVDDFQKAKEPPIKSLPFSLSKPPTPSESPKMDPPPKVTVPPMSIFGTTSGEPRTSSTTPLSSTPFHSTTTAAATSTNGTTVPNFFATSQVLKEKSKPPPLPVLNFNAPSAESGTAPTGTSIFGVLPSTSASTALSDKPATTEANLLARRDKEPAKLPSIFAGSTATPSLLPPIGNPEMTTTKPSVSFMFGKPNEDKGSMTTFQAENNPMTGPFSFGRTVDEKPVPPPFAFGKADKSAPTATASMSTSGSSTLPFKFGKPAAVQEKPSAATDLPFSLATNGTAEREVEAAHIPSKPLLEPNTASTSASSALEGTTTSLFREPTKAATPFTGVPPQSTPSPLPFNFGPLPSSGSAAKPAASTSTETQKPTFSFGPSSSTGPASTTAAPPLVVEAPKPLFVSFPFGQEKEQPEAKSSAFSFGAAPSTPPTISEVKLAPAAPFPFGSSSSSSSTPTAASAAPPITFSFSGGGSAGTDVTTKSPFIFGVPLGSTAAHLERPVTPPKAHDQEVRMEESPAREMQVNGKPAEASVINAPFSFGSATPSGTSGSTLFGGGQSPASTTPFAFGPSSTASNPFATKKREERPFGGFSAPQAPPINTSFSFGKDESRPTSAFTFGQTPTSATNGTPAFSFANASPNPFAAATNSAPGSPSTYAQPAPFAFGASATGFSFGSQPASPAGGANLTLPQPTVSTSTTFVGGPGFGPSSSPASPFTAPLPLAQSTSGDTLFTIGAPPAPPPVGQRQIKKLPRRGNVKR